MIHDERTAVEALARRYEAARDPVSQTAALFDLEDALRGFGETVRTETFDYRISFDDGEMQIRRIDGRHPERGRR